MRCISLTLIVVWIQSTLGDGSINYCGAKMCEYTNAHTFCRYSPGPDPSCKGYVDVRLSDQEKALVLARLNRRRSEVARGIRDLPSAGDMLKLRWVEELAREAQRWADQCQPPSTPEYKDACRDLYSITVGQCVASVLGEAPGLRIETMVDLWYVQSMMYKGDVTSYITPENSSPYYGDFSQMIWSRAYMVGCGRSRFMTPWHGRLRSVERLVCNFAPRGPTRLGAMWLPAPPASVCPPRSRGDNELPALCTYHYNMDETYDEDNIMSLEEHLLLNTILEIERNVTLEYSGSIDEFYLTKLAVATMDNSILTLPSYNSVQKRDLVEKLDIESPNIPAANKNHVDLKLMPNLDALTESYPRLSVKFKTVKKKANIVGRPKTYDIDDWNKSDNLKTNYYEQVRKRTTTERYSYDDHEFVDIQEESTAATTPTNVVLISSLELTMSRDEEEIILNATNAPTETIPILFTNDSTVAFKTILDDTIFNLTILKLLNESVIDTNGLDEYLSDPETVRQLQEALDRMERNLATPTFTSGKVRRELRNIQPTDVPDENRKINNTYKDMKVKDLSEIERNKSIDRGPMINMVLKYMPYLKGYEKSILGDTSVNRASVVSPSFILFTAFL